MKRANLLFVSPKIDGDGLKQYCENCYLEITDEMEKDEIQSNK
jgi:hypothetical protein